MFEIHLPLLKRYQSIAGIAGGIGFCLGIVIPGIGILAWNWQCPFGSGIFHTLGFLALTGLISAIVLGNLAAFILVRIAKFRHASQKTRKKIGDIDGN